MAPKYSKKKAKYTYAERVLSALSSIQKDHRKHAVHMATLRAHVRKAADARKDVMGPQWSQWVSRTVQRLVDDGILDTSDPHGNISFTPNAKKVITNIRRESLGPGVIPSHDQDNKLWKDVARRFSTIGVKRSRRASMLSADDHDIQDVRPRKRQTRKSFGGLTKAQLELELRAAMQRLREAERALPIDGEEDTALREELQSREQEVISLRDEVARLKEQSTSDARLTMTRLPTPPSTQEPASSPLGDRLRPRGHVPSRTSSGTVIPRFSQRPTPEPSDSGSHGSEVEDIVFGGEYDIFPPPTCPNVAFPSDPVPSRGLETPQSSPLLEDRDDFSAGLAEPLTAPIDGSPDEVAKLRQELQHQAELIHQLQAGRDALVMERDELLGNVSSEKLQNRVLEQSLADARRTVERLQDDVRDLTQRSDTLSKELSAAQDNSHVTSDKLAASEKSRDEAVAELEGAKSVILSLKEQLAGAHHSLEAVRATSSAQIKALEDDLKRARGQTAVLTASNGDLECAVTSLQETVQHLREELSDALEQTSSLTVQVQESQGIISNLRISHADAVADASESAREATSLKATVVSLKETLGGVRSQLENATTEAEVLRSRVDVEDASRRRAESQLVATRDERDKLVADIADRVSELATTTGELERVRRTVDDGRRQIEALEDERARLVAAHTSERAVLSDNLAVAHAERRELRALLEQTRTELVGASEKLETVVAERDALTAGLEGADARVAKLEEELEAALGDVRDAEEEIEELRQAKAEDETSILGLKEAYARLRQIQLSVLDEVGDKMISAHTAPTPGHRRRSSILPRRNGVKEREVPS